MEVHVNNKLYAVQPGITIAALLQFIQLPSDKGIAIAINSQVVPKATWQQQTLQSADSITIIRATQGG
ncbi:sulfur carrier protein ThiS [Chitinophaga oryziterrae]|jgi:sulfur carrier protein|uniref:Sulfur carrier protein ThiS n=1 Tax=Chitinophaga oryziterrae TaxID=1031224 RepID=A0A6N8JDX3_9BACT|nr:MULTISPECIES: sulfur carrier protein ThiS [Chitinophaga]MVT42546.1 sulfur carrier protein ThiS [Chitinophaga oryziterrae]SEW10192.1 sulfur carrier protein ThiS [Chitinophaga sp. YR573]